MFNNEDDLYDFDIDLPSEKDTKSKSMKITTTSFENNKKNNSSSNKDNNYTSFSSSPTPSIGGGINALSKAADYLSKYGSKKTEGTKR